MKLLAVSNLFPPNIIGGYEVLCFEVMRALASRGHDVSVLTSSYGNKPAGYSDMHIMQSLKLLAADDNIYAPFSASAEKRSTINLQNIDILNNTLDAIDPDLVFIWNMHFFDASLLTALQTSGRRIVYLLTDNWLIAFYNGQFIADYFDAEVYNRNNKRQRIMLRRLKRMLFRSTRSFPLMSGGAIFASTFMRRLYEEAELRFEDSTVIHHGVKSLIDHSVPYADRKRLLYKNELRLLFAGRVVEIKGVHTAISAASLLKQECPDINIRLTIVGDDRDKPYIQNLHNQIARSKLNNSITFIPPVPESDLFRLFQEHDIYIFPSLYEPFSLTLIHALQAGIPTVASNIGGNPEIIRHAETGMLFNKADSTKACKLIMQLLQDDDLRAKISTQSIKHASSFTFTRMIGQIDDYLHKAQKIHSKGR